MESRRRFYLSSPHRRGLLSSYLEWMAEWDWLTKIPVIVFTASEDPEDERRAYELGVRRYMRKPDDYGKLAEIVKEELRRRFEWKSRLGGAQLRPPPDGKGSAAG